MNKKAFDPRAYAIQTEVVEIEGERYFKTTAVELPHLEVYESSPAAAYEAAVQCIQDLFDAAQTDGRPFPTPEPRVPEIYSGRITLRMGKDLHRKLDAQSKRNGNTLNAEIVSQLAESSSAQELAVNLIAEVKKAVVNIVNGSSASNITVSPLPALGDGHSSGKSRWPNSSVYVTRVATNAITNQLNQYIQPHSMDAALQVKRERAHG
jgi:hypothetical protein